jgi:hypothetical protein
MAREKKKKTDFRLFRRSASDTLDQSRDSADPERLSPLETNSPAKTLPIAVRLKCVVDSAGCQRIGFLFLFRIDFDQHFPESSSI